MKGMYSFTCGTALACAVACASPALAQDEQQSAEQPKVEVVKRGPDGKAQVVRIDGFEVAVCQGDQKDGCINPRDAGQDFGSKEIDYWPGKPASEIDEPLPEHKPDEQATAEPEAQE